MNYANFYNEMNLMYPELAINVEPIDRYNPGVCKFYVPVLVPYLSKENEYTRKEYLNGSNMLNVKPRLYDVSSITIVNFIEINVSPEVCALSGGNYDISGTINLNSDPNSEDNVLYEDLIQTGTLLGSDLKLNANLEYISDEETGEVTSVNLTNGVLTANAEMQNVSLTNGVSGTTSAREVSGTIQIVPSEDNRYIAQNSKWVVLFLGGDINNPVIVSKLPD